MCQLSLDDVANLNIKAIRTLRAGNTTKFRFLVLALLSQALGVLPLEAFAVTIIADNSPTPPRCHRPARLRQGFAVPFGRGSS